MMSADPTAAGTTRVTLIRPGVGREDLTLPEGATLADLLHQARVRTEDQNVWIDGKSMEESVTLQPGTIVTLAPKPKPIPSNDHWSGTVGMFKDDPAFRELTEAVEASREAEKDRS